MSSGRWGRAMSDDDGAEIARLAALPQLQYEREREAAAERLGCPVGILNKLIEAVRATQHPPPGGQGRPLLVTAVEPWPEPVAGADLLNELSTTIRRYVVIDDHAADSIALWIVHTFALEAAYVSPRLAITSPEKRCGKTTLLTILSAITNRALATANLTTAVLFRTIEAVRPTLLIDEADTFGSGMETMRGIINAGHCRGTAKVLRSAPDSREGWEPRAFDVWGPLALAAIGKLPGTIEDRSVRIAMRRRRFDEQVAPLRIDQLDRLKPIARRAARWANDHEVELKAADPIVPSQLHDRAADNWRPLLAIADAVGSEWAERARRAAVGLTPRRRRA
jgi:putative DNA primase/helicase